MRYDTKPDDVEGTMTTEDKLGKKAPDPPWMVIASILFLAGYFVVSSARGLNAYFTQDDGGNILNMHRYWSCSMIEVVGAVLRVVTGVYRPMGGVYYFVLYRLAGFNPLPFRVVCLALMLVNILLAFALFRRLSGSLLAALFGAVLIVNHPAVLELLYSSGTIYELLCFLFYFLTIRYYFVWRQAGQLTGKTTLSWRRLAAILALTGCALDSKEMAMTLPGALFLLELIYFPPKSWSLEEIRSFVVRQCRVPLATAALVLPTIAIKVLTRNPLSDDHRYSSHSVQATIDGYRAYHHFLLYGLLSPDGLSTFGLVTLWIVMALAAFAVRSRPMKFGLGFLIVALLPVCLIAPRGGYMLYIPLMGWALYFGSLFQRLTDDLVRSLGLVRFERVVSFAALAAVGALIVNTHAAKLAPYENGIEAHQNESRRLMERLRKVHPQLPGGSSLLLVDDPAEASYELLFLARLAYVDPALELDRVKMLPAAPKDAALTRYDLLLAGGWELHDVRGLSDMRPPVEVRFPNNSAVEVPEFSGQTVDFASRTIRENRVSGAIAGQRLTLDGSGRGTWTAPPGSPRARIEARWIHPIDGDWQAAAGELKPERP